MTMCTHINTLFLSFHRSQVYNI